MTPDDEIDRTLREALAANGTFDPEKAAVLRRDAVAAFARRLRKVERIAWLYVIGLTSLGVLAALRLLYGSEMKELILFGILLVIAVENLTVIKLWYWIVNGKLSVLKELKQLHLAVPAASGPGAAAGPTAGLPDSMPETRGCSRRERTIWWIGLFAILVVVSTLAQGERIQPPAMTSDSYVTIEADGSGSVVTKVSYVHHDAIPLVSFDFYCGGRKQDIRWIDSRGRPLPVTVSDEGGQTRYRVRLIEPVMPGEPVTYTRIAESSQTATRDGDTWVFRQDLQYGYTTNRYTETILLPQGAELVSTDVEPETQFLRDGAIVLRFRQSLGRQEHLRYTIRYRKS